MLGVIFDGISHSFIVRFLGFVVLLRISINIFYSIYDYLLSKFCPQDITTLGEYAVITGSTDGIGKALAFELAKKGMNIILISRNEEKLKDTAKEIEEEFKVKTCCVKADFTDRSCYTNIKEKIADMDIGVLVNNVGMAYLVPKPYIEITEERLWNELDVNCGSAAIMTRLVIPKMIEKKKGLILNVGSLSAVYGFPRMGLYASTKSFLEMFSYNIEQEVAPYNIQVCCLQPGFVNTKLLEEARPFFNFIAKNYPFLVAFNPDANTYAHHAVDSLNTTSVVLTGYWPHSILLAGSWLPFGLRMKVMKLILSYLEYHVRRAYSKKIK